MRKNNKTNRPLGFQGYYVDIPEGGDPMRAYRFLEELKDRQYFQKPSHWKRETAKRKRQVLRKLQRERDDNRFMGVKRKNK